MNRKPLKQCPGCKQWLTLHDLLYDRAISPQGIQIDPRDPSQCYLQFNHLNQNCLSTFLIHSRELRDACELLEEGHPPGECIGCPGFCTEIHELAACTNPCTMRPYRQFLLSLWWSRSGPATAAGHQDHECVRQTQQSEAELV